MTNSLRICAIIFVVCGVVFHTALLGAAGCIMGGATLLTALWTRRVEHDLRVRHIVPATVNYGEDATICVEVVNTSLLPVPWLQLADSVPLALRKVPPLRRAFALGAGASQRITYPIHGARRGYYHLGPLKLVTGDVLGLFTRQLTTPAAELTVLPRVLPVHELGIPAQAPFGPLSSRVRRGEDPARPIGVRPYQAGDGVRRLDWKSTARHGELLVRRAEPSVAPETTLALAFRSEDYPAHVLKDSLERAVVVAASLGVTLLARKLPVGLLSNGIDPKNPTADVVLLQGKGDGHGQMLLHLLGRLETGGDQPLFTLLARHVLPWGGTLALIVSDLQPELLPHLHVLRKRGQHLMLLLLEPTPGGLALAHQQRIPAFPADERGVPVPEHA